MDKINKKLYILLLISGILELVISVIGALIAEVKLEKVMKSRNL